MHDRIKWSIRVTSPVRLLALLLFSIFLGEMGIMFVLEQYFEITFWQSMILDATLLLLIVFPILYCFLFRPLVYEIEKRTLAESYLKRGEERYRNIFENVQDVYYEINPEGIITEISPSVTKISNGQYSRRDLLGSSVYELYSNPSDRDVLYSLLNEKGEVRDYEVKLRNRDGSLFNCSISAKILYDSLNNPRKITGSIRDITARKKAEEETKRINEQLRIANSEKDRLFSIIAHDLRSPLSTFIGLSEIMAESWMDLKPSEMQKFSDSMLKSATGLYGLLENLLQWSRSKMHVLPFELNRVYLLKEVEEIINLLSETAERKKIVILCRIPQELKLQADINSLHTILRNLISNSIKFTPKGGNIVINAGRWGIERTEITVTDDGIGMSDEMITALFSLDGNTNRPGTEGEPSTGLGLLLCKELVEKHGGSITVESMVNKGTTFRIIL